ncbi:MAG: hypothetical protein ACW98X_22195 [Promethearchaeota archaeon]|jgi:hypothetical protein
MSEEANLNDDSKTVLTLDDGNNVFTVSISGTDHPSTEFMELIELLIVNAGYAPAEIEAYITVWAEEIKASKEN